MNLSKIRKNPALGNALPIVGLIILMLAYTAFRKPGFISAANSFNLIRLAAPLGIICIGQTLAILTGGVDLSVGSVAILTNVVAANIMQGDNANNPKAILICLAIAVLVGLANGVAVAWVKINPFVITLAMSIVTLGAALVYSGGAGGGAASPLIKYLGVGAFMKLPVAALVWFVLTALTLFLLHFTTLGRKIYAVGANKKTARLSGINVSAVLILVYILSAIAAMAAGLVVTGNMGVGTLEWGFDYRLISMAAVIMGGTSFAGGAGGYVSSFLAAAALILLSSILTIEQMHEAWRQVIYGGVILFSLWFSTRKN